ncbi:unnamed protein product [Callosobruchus maculatus]|uniref:Uncharacterized protein n=1 Tax=Callosobruchus maculatus TaxID=64391 RepID=A0A653DCE8_CALMS|nr:unnamed protein product [Callosobruchus maculatus]
MKELELLDIQNRKTYKLVVTNSDYEEIVTNGSFLNYAGISSKYAVLNGRPLIASGILVGMQYNIETLPDFKYYTNFLSLSKEPWLTGGLKAEYRVTAKFSYPIERERPILLYSPTFTKVFYLNWFRYRNSNKKRILRVVWKDSGRPALGDNKRVPVTPTV